MKESLTSGTFAGAGSFRCRRCGYVLTLAGTDALSDCPGCSGRDFVRASLFTTERIAAERGTTVHGGTLARPPRGDRDAQLASARARIEQAGEYLCYEDDGEVRTVALTREWTRIGRSLAADVRFDDPTVSRRHALIVRQPDGVRVLDDRSLNGVFVNGKRVEGKALSDGDEIIVGRYRMSFLSVSAVALRTGPERGERVAGPPAAGPLGTHP
jgi:pSer/pThr/pTyr-binding forkhead associated (FHA) protein